MPLSKKRMRERKRLDRNVKPKSNPNLNEVVKPNQVKISELRGVMGKISADKLAYPITDEIRDEFDELEDWPEIDADGHPIPDF